MILGVGVDIVNIHRISDIYKSYGFRFIKKIMSFAEIIICIQNILGHNIDTKDISLNALELYFNESPHIKAKEKLIVNFLAKRFAGKEAISKALGTGIGKHCRFHDITIKNNHLGAPEVELSDTINNLIRSKIPTHSSHDTSYQMLISFSDEISLVCAFAVLNSYN